MKIKTIKNQAITNINRYYKLVLYIILGVGLLYGAIYLLTRKPQMPVEYQALIDSLNKANSVLMSQQKKLDSIIVEYDARVKEVDTKIDNIKEKTTVVKEYYHEVIQQVNHYDAQQVDSFFKARYKY